MAQLVEEPRAASRAGSGAPLPWPRFTRRVDGPGLLALLLVALAVMAALFAPILAPTTPFKSAGQALQPPSAVHPMGTDDLGRDVLTAVLYGARTSLAVGLLVAGIAAAIGTLVGGVAGYAGGWIDDGLMRATELVQVVPRFFLAVLVIAIFGAGLLNVILVLGLTSWTMIARILRAEIFSLRNRDFVVAAHAVGVRSRSVLFRHVLPNALPSLVIAVALLVGNAILVEASLSFLGLGDPNAISWGYMLNQAQRFMRTAWWMAVFPGVAIVMTVLGFNLLGDLLNDLLTPQR